MQSLVAGHWSLVGAAGVALGLVAAGCGGRTTEAPAPAGSPVAEAAHASHPGDDVPHAHGPGGEAIPLPKLSPEEAQKRRTDSSYQVELAQIHLKYGRADEAIATIRKAIAILAEFGEENAGYFYVLAKAHQAKGDGAGYRKGLEDSIRVYMLLHKQAKQADARNLYCERLSELYGELGDSPKSLEWADQLGSEGESDVLVSRTKARLYLGNAQTDKALKVLETAEAKATAVAQKEQASYNVAEVLLRLNRADDAIARLKGLADGAAEAALRTQAKRLLLEVYDRRGELDKVKLGGNPNGGSGDASPGGGAR